MTAMKTLDLHTHHPAPQPEGIISLSIDDSFELLPGQKYSVGLHPWHYSGFMKPDELDRLREMVSLPDVVAIGETGIDVPKGGLLAAQMSNFKIHAVMAEEVGKPLVLHCVKAHDIIASMRREMSPVQPWVIHGFRGKPTVARILLDAGCSLSFGERFNPETLRSTPTDRIFAETDESPLTIEEIIARLSEAYSSGLLPAITANMQRLLTEES